MYKRMIVAALSAAAFSFVLIAGQAQALTRKECNEEWTSLSASKQAAAKNKTSFVKDCMAKDDAKGAKAEKKEKTEKVEKKAKVEKKEKAEKKEEKAEKKEGKAEKAEKAEKKEKKAEKKEEKVEKKEGKVEKKEGKAEKRGTAGGPGQYSTEAEATRNCSGDTVVWLNTNSGIYHFAGTSDYGNTKQGAYMCQKEADRAGRAAKNEKQPSKK
jgi:outer membrane biosynthesis protein TonB